MVLGKRGMRRVHLVDAAPAVGGHMSWVPQLPGLGEWARVVNYRGIQLNKLRNVEVITGTTLDPSAVLEYGAEIVVVATGSHWSTDGLQGITNEPIPGADASLPHVATPDQVMVGAKAVGKRVLVYDCETYFMGVGMAEKLVRDGHEVTYVTPFEAIAPYTHYTLEFPRLNRTLRALGVTIVLEHVLTGIDPGKATLADAWTEDELELEFDTIVLVTQRVSRRRPVSGALRRSRGTRRRRHQRDLPDRRLRAAVADCRGRLQRTSTRARDRRAESRRRPAIHPRATASARHRRGLRASQSRDHRGSALRPAGEAGNPVTTPLQTLQAELGVEFFEWDGWPWPANFGDAKGEYLAVRRQVGLVDSSGLRKWEFRGPDAIRAVDHITTQDCAAMVDGRVHYTPMCSTDGSILDDITVFRLAADRVMVVSGIASTENHLREATGHPGPRDRSSQ